MVVFISFVVSFFVLLIGVRVGFWLNTWSRKQIATDDKGEVSLVAALQSYRDNTHYTVTCRPPNGEARVYQVNSINDVPEIDHDRVRRTMMRQHTFLDQFLFPEKYDDKQLTTESGGQG